ncbi:NUDIX domain-containing protein [Streptomyces sp. NPDC056084]|uniref:NUDIX domain-containing protein n=1 Tax=Streptomyces sp. NPDC056084 TaxID=3345707 RepID=UPI0035DBC3BA
MTASKPARAMVGSAAAAFIQRADGRVLLVHHAGTGYWVMPGGKTDDVPGRGETPRECCEREGREETGVTVTAGQLLVVQWLPLGRNGAYAHNPFACHLFVFAAAIPPPPPTPSTTSRYPKANFWAGSGGTRPSPPWLLG